MKTPLVHVGAGTLASRSVAAPLRLRVDALATKGRVRLDFRQVAAVSPSFADELFGVLVRAHGIEWIFERLLLVGATDSVLRDIAFALTERQRGFSEDHRAQ